MVDERCKDPGAMAQNASYCLDKANKIIAGGVKDTVDGVAEGAKDAIEGVTGGVKDAVGGIASGAADAILKPIVQSWGDAAAQFMKWLNQWWMDTPSADINSEPVGNLVSNLSYYTALFAVLGFLVGLVRVLMQQNDMKAAGISLGKPILNLVLATSAYGVGIPLLIKAGDGMATWILEKTTDSKVGLDSMFSVEKLMTMPIGLTIIMVLLLLLGSVVNFALMIFRNVMFLILAAFLPTLAAASGTAAGDQAWRKANGWLLALLLFKPVAAGIFALGIYATRSNIISKDDQDQFGADLVQSLTVVLILLMAALALPALIKFVVPAAGAGAGAFSGAGLLAGAVTVAAGAAVIGATGGAAAPAVAGGASAAGGAAGGAGAGGAAASGSGGGAAAGSASGGGSPGAKGSSGKDGAGSSGASAPQSAGASGQNSAGAGDSASSGSKGESGGQPAGGPSGTSAGSQTSSPSTGGPASGDHGSQPSPDRPWSPSSAGGSQPAAESGASGSSGMSAEERKIARAQAIQGIAQDAAANGAMDDEEQR